MQNLLGTHWHNHTHTHTRTRNSTPARTRIRTRVVLVSYSRVVSRLHVVYISSIYIYFCVVVVVWFLLIICYLFMLCCVVHYSSLLYTLHNLIARTYRFLYFILFSALHCAAFAFAFAFRSGQANLTARRSIFECSINCCYCCCCCRATSSCVRAAAVSAHGAQQ